MPSGRSCVVKGPAKIFLTPQSEIFSMFPPADGRLKRNQPHVSKHIGEVLPTHVGLFAPQVELPFRWPPINTAL